MKKRIWPPFSLCAQSLFILEHANNSTGSIIYFSDGLKLSPSHLDEQWGNLLLWQTEFCCRKSKNSYNRLEFVVWTINYLFNTVIFYSEFSRFYRLLDKRCRRRCLWQHRAINWQRAECGNMFRTLPHHFRSHVMPFRDMTHASWPVGHPPRASETTAKGGAFKCWRSAWISSWETEMHNFEAS